MKFTATIDKKYTVWSRLDIEFEAENEKEARNLLRDYRGLPPEAEINNTEILFDTEHEMTPQENNDSPVLDIIHLKEKK